MTRLLFSSLIIINVAKSQYKNNALLPELPQKNASFFLTNQFKNSSKISSFQNIKSEPVGFYQLGPYNDLWGSDILNVPVLSQKKVSLFPSNRILNISTINNKTTLNNKPIYFTVFGFPLKQLGKINSDKPFYGSEKIDR
tara:strand:+ start:2184 stop:2603 length:420 start_codon:yes stop_codon:yes gene_type:complete